MWQRHCTTDANLLVLSCFQANIVWNQVTEKLLENDNVNPNEGAIEEFCRATGELIFWAGFLDQQLNKALIALFALPEHPMIEPLVAQLDPRIKVEIIKKRAKLITADEWRKRIISWAKKVETTNSRRNIVAHHTVRVEPNGVTLQSDQITKILSRLEVAETGITASDAFRLADIEAWIDGARKAYENGQVVLANLDAIRRQLPIGA